jgi:hypothetical protein
MPLPATGTTIRQYADVSVYFGGPATTVRLSVLGTYVGIAANATVRLSASFGGR